MNTGFSDSACHPPCAFALTKEPMTCIEHKGCLNNMGYGQVRRKGVTHLAHRLVAAEKFGAVAIVGKVVRHSCDNPKCVNPDHLELGTQAQNLADMVNRNRQARGAQLPQAKLNEASVEEIRKLYTGKGGPTQKELALRFGVSQSRISYVIHRKDWK